MYFPDINIEEKVQGEKEASFQKRLFDLTQPLFIAIEHPLTGIGLDIEQFQKMRKEFYFSSPALKSLQEQVGVESKVLGTDKGSSNSIMFLFAAMGFPTALLLLYMFFKQQIIKEKNIFKEIKENYYPNSVCETRVSGVKVDKKQDPIKFRDFYIKLVNLVYYLLALFGLILITKIYFGV